MKHYRVLEKSKDYGDSVYFYPQHRVDLLFGLIKIWSDFIDKNDSSVFYLNLDKAKEFIEKFKTNQKRNYKIIHNL